MKSRVEKQFLIWIAVSVAIHLALLLLVVSGLVQQLMPLIRPTGTPPPPPPKITVLKLQDPPKDQPDHNFIPTLPSQESAQVDPNAVLEAERNTILKSHDPAQKPDSQLPSMSGDSKSGVVWQSTPNSPAVKSTPSTPSQQKTPTPPQKTASATPPPSPSPADASAAKTPPSPLGDPTKKDQAQTKQDTPRLDPNTGMPLFPAPMDPSGSTSGKKDATPAPKPTDKPDDTLAQTKQQPPQPKPDPQQQPTPPQQQPQQASPAAPPPSSPSFARSRSQMAGGVPQDDGDPSPAAKETEIGRYKAKLYKTIGTYWYINVEKSMTILGVGEVRFKFYVRSNGMIDQITAISSSGQADVLKGVSLKAIREGLPFEPFSDSMKQQLGDGYWEEITFSIY